MAPVQVTQNRMLRVEGKQFRDRRSTGRAGGKTAWADRAIQRLLVAAFRDPPGFGIGIGVPSLRDRSREERARAHEIYPTQTDAASITDPWTEPASNLTRAPD